MPASTTPDLDKARCQLNKAVARIDKYVDQFGIGTAADTVALATASATIAGAYEQLHYASRPDTGPWVRQQSADHDDTDTTVTV